MKITWFNTYRKNVTLQRVELEDVVRQIREGTVDGGQTGGLAEVVRQLRMMYHLMRINRHEDGSVTTNFQDGTIHLPRLCFGAELTKRKDNILLKQYNGLLVLEVNNLVSYDEAIAVRNQASRLPQTLLAFLGASGRSVKIVCRGELFADRRTNGQPLPKDEESIRIFHHQLYRQARALYAAQLGVTIAGQMPSPEYTVYLSTDPDLYWNKDAIAVYADDSVTPTVVQQQAGDTASDLLPGRNITNTWQLNFLFIIENVLGHYFDLPSEERLAELLMQLAASCLEEGIPQGIALQLTLQHPVFSKDELLVRKTFQAAYCVEQLKKYFEKNKFRPLKSIPEDTLLMMKTEAFLDANYEMRKNIMTGVAQYREKNGLQEDFRDLDQEVRNDMTIRAKEMGLKSWDKDIDRFIDSTRITQYDPVNEWLEHLPRWDGKDRIPALAARVPTNQPHWQQYLRTWLLGMVAHWMGKSSLTGNALVPLLIGRQGCGKSSFCRILLPPELRDYYNDRITFKNETDLNLGLTSFALINIDEFDKVTQRQQVLLKYLLSTADVKFRPPYGKAVKQYRRYASFMGPTNDPKPLSDPTGSRRFLCVEVTGDIDFSDTLDHRQLYAQLRQQVLDGERYWLDDEETRSLIEDNERFQRVNGLEEMIAETFTQPSGDDAGRWWTVSEISQRLQERYRSQEIRNSSLATIGRTLSLPRFHFESKRRPQGMVYKLAER